MKEVKHTRIVTAYFSISQVYNVKVSYLIVYCNVSRSPPNSKTYSVDRGSGSSETPAVYVLG